MSWYRIELSQEDYINFKHSNIQKQFEKLWDAAGAPNIVLFSKAL